MLPTSHQVAHESMSYSRLITLRNGNAISSISWKCNPKGKGVTSKVTSSGKSPCGFSRHPTSAIYWRSNPKGKGAVLKTASSVRKGVWDFKIPFLRHLWSCKPNQARQRVANSPVGVERSRGGSNPPNSEFQPSNSWL